MFAMQLSIFYAHNYNYVIATPHLLDSNNTTIVSSLGWNVFLFVRVGGIDLTATAV